MGEKLNKYKEKENAWISYEYLPRKPFSLAEVADD